MSLKRLAIIIIVSNLVAAVLFWFGIIAALAKISIVLFVLITFLAGIGFTSMFANPVAVGTIILLGASGQNPFLIAAIAGLGAFIGDIAMFEMVHPSHKRLKQNKVSATFSTIVHHLVLRRSFQWLIGLTGALIILSPLSDEVGISLLSRTRVQFKTFALMTLFLNFIGILAIIYVSSFLQTIKLW